MQEKILALAEEFRKEVQQVENTQGVEHLKIHYLGKKGKIPELLLLLRECSSEERPLMGKLLNQLKEEISQNLEELKSRLEKEEVEKRMEKEVLDISLPGRQRFSGRKHPITLIAQEILDVLMGMGFSVQYGPDIDSDYYNFEGLNYAPDHPARDMQDTFYISPDLLLRSHTSNTQLRIMQTHKPPLRIAAPGTVYRNENISARSHVFFHQVEGLYIDKGVSFADLLATMREFWNKLFHEPTLVRFRPSYFPFVEPGLEVDLACLACQQKGCRLCKHTGWLEVAGAGMVHPEVLKNGGIDPEEYTGYAWGLGVERIAMLRYGIKDIRMFTENDLRFLEQFNSP